MKSKIRLFALALVLSLTFLSTSASASVCNCGCVSNDGLIQDQTNPGCPSYGQPSGFPSQDQCIDPGQLPNGVSCVIVKDGVAIQGMCGCRPAGR